MDNMTDRVSAWLGVPALSRAWRDCQSALKALRFLREDLTETAKSGYLTASIDIVDEMMLELDHLDADVAMLLRTAHERMIPPQRSDDEQHS